MKKGLKVFLIIGISLVLVGAILLAVSVSLFNLNFKTLTTTKFVNKTHKIEDKITAIDIDALESDVVVKTASDGIAKVTLRESDKIYHKVEVVDGVLKISYRDDSKWYNRIGVYTDGYTVVVEVAPQSEMFTELKINSASGDILVAKDVLTENISANSISGEINVMAHVAYGMSLKSVSGDIYTDTLNPMSLDLTTTSGDIKVDNMVVGGKGVLKSVSGDIELNSCAAVGFDITTTSGDVEGNLLNEMTYNVKTVSGEVSVPDTFGAGICKITTTSGDVEFE